MARESVANGSDVPREVARQPASAKVSSIIDVARSIVIARRSAAKRNGTFRYGDQMSQFIDNLGEEFACAMLLVDFKFAALPVVTDGVHHGAEQRVAQHGNRATAQVKIQYPSPRRLEIAATKAVDQCILGRFPAALSLAGSCG